MADEKKSFYVTTPIYYVTAHPHLGSLYSTVLADVLKRWHMLQGRNTFFLTGTDEHGQKIAQAAADAGKEPKAFADGFIGSYKDVWQQYQISYDHFIRTTDPEHVSGVQQFVQKLLDTGDIYKDVYAGWYCTPCETFVTEKDAGDSAQGPTCPSCGRPTTQVEEETYFFKLSAYQDKLLQFYQDHPDFIVPRERAHEVTAFMEVGLKDLSISRTTVSWGIPFPNDPQHTVYVWVDALINYLTGVGYGQAAHQKDFEKWWPADIHLLGKDIVRFHGIYWPALLMAAGLPLPKQLLVHGWIQIDKQKMSKSLGNVVDPVVLHDVYGSDAVRYYLVRQMGVNQDGDFTIADLEQRINSDLANDLGNLLQRMIKLAFKWDISSVQAPTVWSAASVGLRDAAWNMVEDFQEAMRDCEFHVALARLWKFIHQVNAYFHEQEPWKVAKVDTQKFCEIISATCHSLRVIGILAWPVMPEKMAELLRAIGAEFDPHDNTLQDLELGIWHKEFRLMDIGSLFQKIEPKELVEQEEKKQDLPSDPTITIDDFTKVILVVGTITESVAVEKSEKLLKLQVDCGQFGTRQVLSGIAKFYKPEQLVGKQAVFVINVKPRKMMGIESQGMLLTAEDSAGGLQLISVTGDVPPGTRLR